MVVSTGVPAAIASSTGRREALVERGQRERLRSGVQAGQQRVVDVPEQAQPVQTLLGGELRPVAARDRELDALGRQRPRGGHERAEVLARRVGGDAEHIGPLEPERAARTVGVRAGREAGVDAAGHDGGSAPGRRPAAPRARTGRTRTPSRSAARGHASTGSSRRCQAAYAPEYQPGWRSAAASWSTRHGAARDGGGEVRRAQQQRRPHPRDAGRQHELLPRVARPVHQPRRRAQHGVRAGAEDRQARGQLARPALDAAQLGARGGSCVDGDRRGQRPHYPRRVCKLVVRGARLSGTCGFIRSMVRTGDPR